MSAAAVGITGMAWCTALGDDVDEVWQALLAGRTGITEVSSEHELRSLRVGAVDRVDPELPPTRRQRLMTVDALTRALADAALAADDADLLAVFGTSYGPHLDDPDTVSLSQWAATAAGDAGLVRAPLVVSTACSAGSDAVAVALELLRSGSASRCVCVGVDVLTPAKRLGHSLLGTMSASDLRAFDCRHDGTLLGEGAGVLVLETVAAARARGAGLLALVAGAGSSNDATGSAVPDPSGRALELAVDRALRSAGRQRDEVSLINAHGSGTPANDVLESTTYSRLFAAAERPPALFATKGSFGHTLGATGAIEAMTVIQALRTGWLPPVYELAQPLPDLRLPVVTAAAPVTDGVGLSVTLGFGGFNTCLALTKAPADDAR